GLTSTALAFPISYGGRREERLRGTGGDVAGQPLHDERPGLRGVPQINLGVPVAEAVVSEQHRGTGLGAVGGTKLPFPGRALPEREARGDLHPNQLAGFGADLGDEVHGRLGEPEPGLVGRYVAVGGPEGALPV